MQIVDSKKFTALTFAAYRNQTNCFKIIFEYALRYSINNFKDNYIEKIKNWVN
jgi:hypothetical protein